MVQVLIVILKDIANDPARLTTALMSQGIDKLKPQNIKESQIAFSCNSAFDNQPRYVKVLLKRIKNVSLHTTVTTLEKKKAQSMFLWLSSTCYIII